LEQSLKSVLVRIEINTYIAGDQPTTALSNGRALDFLA
jgi:hypothetical protein